MRALPVNLTIRRRQHGLRLVDSMGAFIAAGALHAGSPDVHDQRVTFSGAAIEPLAPGLTPDAFGAPNARGASQARFMLLTHQHENTRT